MKNGFDIEWSSDAERHLSAIFDYLESRWSEREISNFAELLETYLHTISRNPATFPYYDREKNIRRCVLSSQTTIYYKEVAFENRVVILALFNNRRNPATLNI